ncbi:MAG: DUF6057 family protein [Bacteroidaceae bacterium]|nr:DUF6057 family protein [Bacteroidaceae bacterium]
MNQKEENKIPVLISKTRWILPIAVWAILSFCTPQFLQKVEERSFFEFDLFWFCGFLDKPSGILSWCSLFFTQFLYIPWLGALVWVLLLTLSAELTRIVFRMPSQISFCTYIPAAIFIAYNMSMGYMIYLMNHPGFFFLPVLGYLWALLTVIALRKAEKPVTSIVFTVIWGFAGYYVAGFYGLAGIAAAAIDKAVSKNKYRGRMLSLAVAAAVVILAPILFLGTTTYYLSTAWTIGIPDHVHSVSLERLQLPIIIAFLFFLLAPLSGMLEKMASKSIVYIQCTALTAAIAIPAISWYRDSNFKTELKMIQAAENLEWENIPALLNRLSTEKENDSSWQPTRVMVVLKDLALIKTGQEGNRAFDFEDGDKDQKRRWDVQMSMQIGWIMGFHYGIPGLCQRWCYEESMLFGWSNTTLKYNAMTSILFGNTELANKYLNKLGHTLFYNKWAKKQRPLCNDRNLIEKTAPYDQILPLMCYDDLISSDQEGCEIFLKRHFNGPSPQNSTPLYDRVSLLFAIKSKDPTLFWTRFFLYLDSNNPEKIDRYYQEAAYLYSNLENNGLLEALPFDDQVKKLYDSFKATSSKIGPKSMNEARNLFPANLRHTFFYYYYYVNNLNVF